MRLFFIPFLLSLLSLFANAGIFVGAGVGVTDGAILEAGYKMNPFIAIRGRAGYLPSTNLKMLARGFETSASTPFGSIDKLDFKSQSFDIGLEITPVPLVPIIRGFKIIGAVQYMNANLDLSSTLNGTYSFNGINKTVNGSINAMVSNKQNFAPYLGLGWDIINLPIISLRLTAGATMRSFTVESYSVSGNVSSIPTSDIQAEVARLQNKIDGKKVIPSVSLTMRATLPGIPFIPGI